jgi:hypothetical protein
MAADMIADPRPHDNGRRRSRTGARTRRRPAVRVRAYPFTPPSVSPEMRYRLSTRNSATTGMHTSTEPAA